MLKMAKMQRVPPYEISEKSQKWKEWKRKNVARFLTRSEKVGKYIWRIQDSFSASSYGLSLGRWLITGADFDPRCGFYWPEFRACVMLSYWPGMMWWMLSYRVMVWLWVPITGLRLETCGWDYCMHDIFTRGCVFRYSWDLVADIYWGMGADSRYDVSNVDASSGRVRLCDCSLGCNCDIHRDPCTVLTVLQLRDVYLRKLTNWGLFICAGALLEIELFLSDHPTNSPETSISSICGRNILRFKHLPTRATLNHL